MKILHVIRDLTVTTGGPVSALLGLTEAQAALGHKVTVLATDGRDGPKVEPKGVQLEIVSARTGSWSWSHALSAALERLVPEADIVHLHMVWDYPIWAAARSARRHCKPFILRPCGQLDQWSLMQKRWKKRAYLTLFGTQLREAAAIHFTTEGERHGSQAATGRIPSFVIPVGVPENAYRDLPPRTAFATRFPQLASRRIVLFLGRLHSKKQPELLIDAFARIVDAFDDLHLVLAGPGDPDYVARLRAQVEAVGIGWRTTFTGPLFGASVTEAYRAADVFALPSLQENFGIAIVEAMAAGCPVLVSGRLDLASQIEDSETGLVRPASVDEFAAALHTLIAHGPMRETMGANGRRLVMERYTWGPIAQATVEAYETVLKDAA